MARVPYIRTPILSADAAVRRELDVEFRKIEAILNNLSGENYPVTHAQLPDRGTNNHAAIDAHLDNDHGWSGACPGNDQTIPIYNCAAGGFGPSTIKWDGTTNPDFPSYRINASLLFNQGEIIGFFDGEGSHLGGIGNPTAPELDTLFFIGSFDIAQWYDPAFRRPVFFGGSRVTIEAKSECSLILPGVTANSDGYNLELLPDGESLVAVPNPSPDESWSDTSASNGVALITGAGLEPWQTFPADGASQPELLEITIPAGTAAGNAVIHVRVRVKNTSTKTGEIILGIADDGATPTTDRQSLFIIPPLFSGNLEFSITEPVSEPPSDVVATVWYQATGGHPQFNLLTDTTNGDHNLDVSIGHGGSSSSSASRVTYDPTNDPLTLETNVQDAMIQHALDIKALLDAFPVGALLFNSAAAFDPNGVIPNTTWARFGEGRMLISSDDATYPVGATGGLATHTLTEVEMPAHTHGPGWGTHHVDFDGTAGGVADSNPGGDLKTNISSNTASTGSGGAHNNMPPYISVYIWVRTA